MSVKQQTSEHNAKAGKDGERDSSGWSAALYNQGASFVYSSSYVAPVLELLAAKPGERILDIGCGSGELTLLLQSIVEKQEGGVVVGTDFSESMVSAVFFAVATKIGAQLTSIIFCVADRQGQTERGEARVTGRRAGAGAAAGRAGGAGEIRRRVQQCRAALVQARSARSAEQRQEVPEAGWKDCCRDGGIHELHR